MSPVAPIAHLIAIAAGVLGGFWLGGVVTPDLPSADPGVTVEEEVRGGDGESLYRAGPLAEAVTQTVDQLGPGAEVTRVMISPASLEATDAGDGEPLPLESMPVDAPERIVAGAEAAREDAGGKGPIGLDDVLEFEWTPGNPTDSEWYVLLDINTVSVPTELTASRDGSEVRVGRP